MHQNAFLERKRLRCSNEVPITYYYDELSSINNKYLNDNINESTIL